MRLETHLAATVVVGGVAMWATKEVTVANLAALFMGGVGIDLIDHGGWILAKVRPLTKENVEKVMWGKFERSEPEFYLFHTLEVSVLMGILTSWSVFGRYFMLAYGLHLLMDGISYRVKWGNWKWLKHWIMWNYAKKVI